MTGFAVHHVSVGAAAGRIGLSPLPGCTGAYARDLSLVRAWRPDLVISMTTQVEMSSLGAGALAADLQRFGMEWVHFPIEDFGAPPPEGQLAWPGLSQRAHEVLAQGGRILVHCRGGCGRSGMIALRLMIEAGEDPDQALTRLRAQRPCAVETAGQMEWAGQGAVQAADRAAGSERAQ